MSPAGATGSQPRGCLGLGSPEAYLLEGFENKEFMWDMNSMGTAVEAREGGQEKKWTRGTGQ